MKRKYPALSLEPQKLDAGTWYYERPRGLELIRYHADTGEGPERVRIPWRLLIASVKRYEARRRAKANSKR